MRLLVVKLHALGDMVIATPAMHRLRQGLPDARIELLTVSWTAPAVKGNPCIDRLMAVKDDILFRPGMGTIPETFALVGMLRRQRYDAAVLFHRNRMVNRFIALCGISPRFRFDGGEDGRSVLLDEGRHSALTACELADLAVKELGGAAAEPPCLDDLRYDWLVDPQEANDADRLLAAAGLEAGSFAAVMPGGGVNPNIATTERRWSAGRFAGLIDRMNGEFSIRSVLLGGRDEAGLSAQIAACSKGVALDLIGRVNVRIAAAVIARARLAISNDSGLLHIASAVGRPVVGIFGPTGVRLKLPPGESYPVSLGLPCSPCYFTVFKGCIFDRIRCLEELEVDAVMEVVRGALSAVSGEGKSG